MAVGRNSEGDEDGGLLPPFVMQGFAALFALFGAAVSAVGIERQDVAVIVFGLLGKGFSTRDRCRPGIEAPEQLSMYRSQLCALGQAPGQASDESGGFR